MTRHMMIDLETLGQAHDAAIVECAFVTFDPNIPNGQDDPELFGMALFVDLADALRRGVADGDTLKWWMLQPDNVRNFVMLNGGRVTIDAVLTALRTYYTGYTHRAGPSYHSLWEPTGLTPTADLPPCEKMWTYKEYDAVILRWQYLTNTGGLPPWEFRDVLDFRTLQQHFGEPSREGYHYADEHYPGLRHEALHDCYRQVGAVKAIYAEIAHLRAVRDRVSGLLDK